MVLRAGVWPSCTWIMVLATMFALDSAYAQRTATVVVEPPEPPEAPVITDDIYRQLFQIQVRILKARSDAERDSLALVKERLLTQIENSELLELDRRHRAEEVLAELENELEDVDWDDASQHVNEVLDEIGVGLGELGEMIENFSFEIDGDKIQVGDGEGSSFRFNVSDDIKRDIADVIATFDEEIGEAIREGGQDGEGFKIFAPEAIERWSQIASRRRDTKKKRVVAESVFRMAEDFELAEDEVVLGDVIVIGADGYILGEVQGNVYVIVGDIFIEGEGSIGADAGCIGGSIVMEDDAVVHGKMFDTSGFVPMPGFGSGSGPWQYTVHGVRVAALGLLLVLGFAILGDRLQTMADFTANRPMRNLVAGSFWLSITIGCFVVAAVGLAITVIGIPVVLVLTVAFGGVLLGAYFVACQVLGKRLISLTGADKPHAVWVAGLLGLAMLEVPSLLATSMPTGSGFSPALPLHILDYLLRFMALALGVGAIVATRFGGRQPVPAVID